jgi:2-methylcitrate dehydratase PrpD
MTTATLTSPSPQPAETPELALPEGVTREAVAFIENVRFDDIPEEAVRIGRRCLIDTLGLYLAGTEGESVQILVRLAARQGGAEEARLLAGGGRKVPAGLAARVLGTAGHAHDWDDTQVSRDPRHQYGLLTHPSVPPLSAAIAVSQTVGGADGRAFMTAFLVGFEVECKISEWMSRDHYLRGHHSSGTVGTFGASAAAAKLMGLTGERLAHALGIAAAMAAGIRCSFGTMTKPLHVGRAAENGVTAAVMAADGFTADPQALDGRWGFMAVLGGGAYPEKLSQGFGRAWTIVEPGVSIKPYPSGILTHQAMDAMLRLVADNDVKPDEIAAIRFHAGSNILNPIRYPVAENHLQAKFSMAALLSMIALYRKAGKREFSDAVMGSSEMQAMQRRVSTHLDPEIEAQGFDRIRSRIELDTHDGRTVTQWADERYRGGPDLDMSDAEVEEKLRDCAEGVVSDQAAAEIAALAWRVTELDAAGLDGLLARVHEGGA